MSANNFCFSSENSDSRIDNRNESEFRLTSLSDILPEEIHQPFGFTNYFSFENAESTNHGTYRTEYESSNFNSIGFSYVTSSKYLPPSEQVECNESWDDSTKTWTHLETMCCASSVPHDCSTENVERSNREPITSPMESSQEISASTASTASTSTQEAQSSNENVSELETAAVTNESVAMIIERNLRKKESKAEEKRRLMKEKNIGKHSVKAACTCLKLCPLKISHERRIEINKSFHQFDGVAQKLYIRSQTSSPSSSVDANRNRRSIIEYFLNDDLCTSVNVCQKFFLATLGFNPNNNTFVRNALKAEFPTADQRGKYPRDNSCIEANVITHIMSFHPEVSHHRREHAPHRLYLPSDVSIVKMHSYFVSSYPEKNCSYDYYRKMVEKMNISFAKLGHEKCEDCEKYHQHKVLCTATETEPNCDVCIEHIEHKRRYDRTRIEYEADKLQPFDPKHIRVSTDQQKVVMLPRIEQFKEVLFAKRLRGFNQTFAPLGSTKHNPVFACIWHDAIAGRKKEDVISCYHAFLLKHRDAAEITIWCDNCTSQNKCWALFTFFVYIVNSTEISANQINIKFLQKGHTFMSADSFHHQVELSMKSRENSAVYDFDDFVDSVENANGGRIYCKEMNFFNFAEWPDSSSIAKLNKCEPRPYVNDFTKLMFVRGKKIMYYANDFDDDFIELDFIKIKDMDLKRPSPRTNIQGIPQQTKNVIVEQLTPLMPPNRRQFWENL